jgi:hypothetical protein
MPDQTESEKSDLCHSAKQQKASFVENKKSKETKVISTIIFGTVFGTIDSKQFVYPR